MNVFLKFISIGIIGTIILMLGGCESSKITDDDVYQLNDELALETESKNIQPYHSAKMYILTNEDIQTIKSEGFVDVKRDVIGSDSVFRFWQFEYEAKTYEFFRAFLNFFELNDSWITKDGWELQLYNSFLPLENYYNVWGLHDTHGLKPHLYTVINDSFFVGRLLSARGLNAAFGLIEPDQESVELNNVEVFLTNKISVEHPILDFTLINHTGYELDWINLYNDFEIQYFDGEDWILLPRNWRPETSSRHVNYESFQASMFLDHRNTFPPGETSKSFELEFTPTFPARPGQYRLISYLFSPGGTKIRNLIIYFEIQ